MKGFLSLAIVMLLLFMLKLKFTRRNDVFVPRKSIKS
jgi:hypothetical protein